MEITRTNGRRVDDVGHVLISGDEDNLKKDYGTHGKHPISNSLIELSLNNINFPIDKIKTKIYNFTKGLMMYRSKWEGTRYQGRAYKTHIIYGARNEYPNIRSISPLVIHELGHALMYSAMDCTYTTHMQNEKFQEYIKLRRIPKHFTDKSDWRMRPAEIFAEDFRYLFGDDSHKSEPFSTFDKGNEPGEEIKQFMLNLAGLTENEELKTDIKEEDDNMNNKLLMPMKDRENWKVTSEYGIARAYVINGVPHNDFHQGIDFAPKNNKANYEFQAIGDGEITYASHSTDGYGIHCYLKIGEVYFVYAHMSSMFVKTGNKVKAGDSIGVLGDSGHTTGPHLHFEARDKMTAKRINYNPANALSIKNEKGNIRFIGNSRLPNMEGVEPWGKKSWIKMFRAGINDGEGATNTVTEQQIAVFFDRLGLLGPDEEVQDGE